MPIHNNDVAEIFDELADLLEIRGENQFRVRAYRNAARTVASLSRSVAELAAEEKGLDGIPGIGKDLADKIRTIVATKKLPLLEDMKKELPEGLSTLMKVRGLGPKKIAAPLQGAQGRLARGPEERPPPRGRSASSPASARRRSRPSSRSSAGPRSPGTAPRGSSWPWPSRS